jgi:hypothetical protein
VTGFWATVPTDRVVHLCGASSDALALAVEALPDDSPSIVTYYPGCESSLPEAVAALLAELDGLAVEILRTRRLEPADADYFGPFLPDLTARALGGRHQGPSRLTAEIRAAGLVRLLAGSCGRDRLVIMVRPVGHLSLDVLDVLVAAGEWFVRHGDAGVWLTGECWAAIDRVSQAHVQLPCELAAIASLAPDTPMLPAPPAVAFPAVRGRPRADSRAECSLEAALARQPWASGRCWNETYQPDPLTPAITVDLIWREERCVVEIDGPEHRSPLHFEADRRRDVRLQLDGYAVLRFTNAQIHHDLAFVVDLLERFITSRRRLGAERLIHV